MSKEINIIFGENLKKYRNKLNLTQEQIALELDMDLSTIAKYEKGSRCPNLKIAAKIATVLNIKISKLVEENV